MKTTAFIRTALLAATALVSVTANSHAWWNKDWTARRPVTIDTTKTGFEITEPVGTATILLRLHQGNFDFSTAKEDGTDIRFVTEDDKTPLESRVEKWDALMNEGFVWVKVPDIKPGAQTKIWLYSGNPEITAEEAADPLAAYDADTVLAYNFTAATPKDATKNANNATSGGTLSEGALIGPGMRLLGNTAAKIPGSETLRAEANQPFTLSTWLKQSTLNEKGVLFDWGDDSARFQVVFQAGAPVVTITSASGTSKSTPADPVAPNVWKHIAVVSDGSSTKLFVDGKEYSSVAAGLPAIVGEATLGADADGKNGLVGEIDEFSLSKTARPAGWVQLAYTGQAGNDASTKLVALGEGEGGASAGGHGGAMEHVMLFGDIAKNMMFDGWIAIGVCVIMMFAGWTVAFVKFVNLDKIKKGNAEFQRLWKDVATDLTAMDLDNPESSKTFGGKIGKKGLTLLADSPLYHIYHVGSEEIRHRLGFGKNKGQGLSARSIQAIRASLDAALVHEQHRLGNGLVYLTTSIAGGPYVGLLGTVVGVMITFAIIAKSGEVDVNSIAPGIASALLATTVGLLVAIPALFMYSFLNTSIKNTVSAMQVFIDEFVAKVAEFYPTPGDSGLTVPIRQIRTPEEAARIEETKGDENAAIMDNLIKHK
jgi:biopolymer transport protein ExbB